MKYSLMTVYDRRSVKRISLIILSMALLAGCYMAFTPFKASAAACTAPATDYGTATSTINITNAGTYRVWSRIMAPDTSANSYLLEIDGNTCYTVGDSNIAANTWTWVDYQNGTASSKVQQSLSAGNHTIKMIGREASVKLGRVLFVTDLNCVPTGNGDNCATAGDTEAPALDITAPAASANVSSTVNIAATATDNVAVTKVEFYVSGVLMTTDTAPPYSYSWDSKTIANGTTSLMVKAYDGAGNSSSDTVQVQVSNGDTQVPSVPAGVSAQANSYNKVTVTWTASTDNTAVTGYRVSRGGVVLSQVMNGTQYVDTTVLPNTAYSYRVSAFDADGNTSALSSEAKVTTPNVPDTQAPSAPGNLHAGAVSTTQINLNWSASTDNVGVASYDIYRAAGNGSAGKVATVNTLSYGDTGLSPATAYTYYIVAHDVAGNASQGSNSATAQTHAPPQPPAVPVGVLKGRVNYRQNSGRHATVIITVQGVKRIYDTNRRGNYLITGIPAGTYKVRYQAKGSYDKVVTVKIKANKTKTQNVTLRRR